ncbi:hypothetical protein HELRODRAFT_102897 [Helobdella robusta]|uniref:LIM zinc-binding domain-containing protein n=1 Tax=Helobdella robusta TaxID=6412 RepID=T1EDC9_HELRO|nr:hypothetical protein HELRODRAFT_102897 [Helobdella robusta]ESN94871.1 hypothetical protein HELRODRAFT_102897 [Helobdella robusta]
MVNLNGKVWHQKCFVCAQCFQQFPDGIFFEFEGRLYCAHDFQILFAPYCSSCKEFILGRVIKAMNTNWHPHCFLCAQCSAQLADVGFIKTGNRALCKSCNEEEKARLVGKHICFKCKTVVDENDFLRFNHEVFHAYHFKCHDCGCELTSSAREKDHELYCLRCHDKMGIPICAACRRPIEERAVHALGKIWHTEHFVCCKCEKPFFGNRHYEKRGLAYCETHYFQAFGNTCFYCNSVITGDTFTAFNKEWCCGHFSCSLCDRKMDNKTKFIEFDCKPICKACFKKFPSELVKRQRKALQQEQKNSKK